MKIYLSGLIFLVFLCISLPAGAVDLVLEKNKQGIHLHAQNQALSRILQSIGQKSGIAFYMKEELYETPVTTDIQAPDWKSLTSSLLKDFSKIEMWSEGTEGSKIRITGLGDYVPPTGGRLASKGPTIIQNSPTATKNTPSTARTQRKRFKRPEPPKRARELLPNHPLAKLPSHVFLEPAITNYLLEKNVDIPPEFKKEYGLSTDEEDGGRGAYMRERKSYPIPNEIYNDPALDEYLKAVGLPKPPQIPVGFKKIDPSQPGHNR